MAVASTRINFSLFRGVVAVREEAMLASLVYVIGLVVGLRLASVAVLHNHVVPRLSLRQFVDSDLALAAGCVEGHESHLQLPVRADYKIKILHLLRPFSWDLSRLNVAH